MTEAVPEAKSDATSHTRPEKTAVTMVLDRSGSMECCRAATIESVNAYLAKSRADENLKDADFELAIFDTEAYQTIRAGKLAGVKDISRDDFEPRGGTPLLDAVGRGIDGLDKRAVDDKAVLVIVTDGEENSSRKHSDESIKALLDNRQEKGWLVIFLGAGLNSARQGMRMGVVSANVASIALDGASLGATMDAMAETNAVYAAMPTPQASRAYARSEKFSPKLRMAMGDSSGGKDLDAADADDSRNGLRKLFTRRSKASPPPPSRSSDGDAWLKPESDAWDR
jgi:VWA domain containing CoxE-like protein